VNGWTRFGGYLGLVGLVGSIAILSIVPQQRYTSSSLRDQAGTAAIGSYFLIVARLFYLTFHGDGRSSRVLAGVAMMTMILAGVGFIGIALLLATTSAPSAA
jgi:hypothetical protein